MDLGSAVRVLLRRWLVLVIGLVLTLGASAYLYIQTPPRYQATARMLLLLPAESRGTESADSPFLNLPNGLQVLAGIVATAPNSRAFHDTMTAAGLTSQYELETDPRSPTITISVEGSDAGNVIASRDRVIQGVKDELLTVQREENAPSRQLAHARVYAIEETPDLVQGDRTRGTLTVLGVGGLITLLTAFLVDRVIQLRRERRVRPKGEHLTGDEQVSSEEQLSDVGQVSSEEQLSDVGQVSSDEQLSDVGQVSSDEQLSDVGQVSSDEQLSDVGQVSSDEQLSDVGQVSSDEQLSDVGQVSSDEQLSDVGQVSSDEQLSDVGQVSSDEQPTDRAKMGNSDQVPEPDQVAYPPQEEQTVDSWDLYIHEYAPVNGGRAFTSERWVGNERGVNGLSLDEDEARRSVEEEFTNRGRASSRA